MKFSNIHLMNYLYLNHNLYCKSIAHKNSLSKFKVKEHLTPRSHIQNISLLMNKICKQTTLKEIMI